MEFSLARAGAYRWLGAGFHRPSAQILASLTSEFTFGPVQSALTLLPSTHARLAEARTEAFGEAVSRQPCEVLELHLVDYCRLFLGPGELRCPPYGSVYLDGGVAMGPSTLDALARYRQEGFAVTPDWREPPDHVAIELEFMAHLAAREAGERERGHAGAARAAVGAQLRFLDGHVGRWGPALSRRLAAGAEAPLYQLLSELLPAWLERDRNLLAAAAHTDLEGAH